jgi:hypothetical protein
MDTNQESNSTRIGIAVKNVGTAVATADVALYHGEISYERLIGYYKDIKFAAGSYRGISFEWNTTGISGNQRIIAKIIEPMDPSQRNNIATFEVYIWKPGMAPIATIDLIDPNPAERLGDVNITFSGSGKFVDIDGYIWNASGETLGTASHMSVLATDFDIGTHNISLVVRSIEGIWSEPAYMDLVITGPDGYPVAVILEVTPNVMKTYENVYLRGKGESHIGIDEYEWRCGDNTIGATSELEVPGDDLGTGNLTIEFRVRDDEGRWSIPDVRNVTVLEKEPPTITINAPEGDERISGIVTVAGATSGERAIERVEISIDSDEWQRCTNDAGEWSEWNYDWDTTDLNNGKVTIEVRALDVDNDYCEDSIEVVVDNEDPVLPQAPTLEIISPSDGSGPFAFNVMLIGTATDDDGYVEAIEVSVDDDDFDDPEYVDVDDEWEVSLNVSLLSPGNISLSARARDNEGYYSSISSVTVQVDNRRPIAIIEKVLPEEPTDAEVITLTGNGSNAVIVSYEWSSDIEGHLGEGAELQLQPGALSAGNHEISFVVIGANCLRSRRDTYQLTIISEGSVPGGGDNPDGDGSDDDDIQGSNLLMMFLFALAIIIAVIVSRQPRGGVTEVSVVDVVDITSERVNGPVRICESCHGTATYYQQYDRDYCHACQEYLPVMGASRSSEG